MDDRHYKKEGIKYERVSNILSTYNDPKLEAWKINSAKNAVLKYEDTLINRDTILKCFRSATEVGKHAMGIGTNVDDAIRGHYEGYAIKLKTKEAENCFKAFLQWKQDYGVETAISGTTLYDDDSRIAGTPDLWLPDETLDIKCSSAIRDNYWLQTEWYARKKGHSFKSILRLDKSLGIYEYKKIPVSDYHLQVFEALITAFRYYNQVPQ